METNVSDGNTPVGQSGMGTLHQMERSASAAIDKARGTVEDGVESAQRTMESTVEKAKEAATNAAHNVADAANYVGQKAEKATSSVGSAMENTGQYLKNDGLHHMLNDVTDLIRRNPVPAMLIGVGIGFLCAQAAGRRNA
jgi:vacuolar-type H+-ATPase subunit H